MSPLSWVNFISSQTQSEIYDVERKQSIHEPRLPEMTSPNRTARSPLTRAMEAIGNLRDEGFTNIERSGQMAALVAHREIEVTAVAHKTGLFYQRFIPFRKQLMALLADTYRRHFKLALAHPEEVAGDPHEWTLNQIQPAIGAALERIREWCMLACDGENRFVQRIGSIPFVPGQTVSFSIPTTVPPLPPPETWRAPAWLFAISLAHVGIGPVKTKHVPARNSEQKLGASHTRLLLKGARRTFLWELQAAIETVRNEEIAAAGAIPAETASRQAQGPDERKGAKHSLRGFEGLSSKVADLSLYMHNLTEKQQLAFSLKYEYGLGLSDIASRMGLDRKTAYEHIAAARRKLEQTISSDKRKALRTKSTPE